MAIKRADIWVPTKDATAIASELNYGKTMYVAGEKITGTRNPGIDQYTVSLLHFEGSNNGTTFTDETGKTWSATGTAKTSTTKKAYGLASGYFDGNSDYIGTSDSDDFNFGSGNWTIDCWVNFDYFVSPYNHAIFEIKDDNSNFFEASFYRKEIGIECVSGGVRQFLYLRTFTVEIVQGNWVHIAIVRNGTALLLFVNGALTSTTENTAISTKTIPDFTGDFKIGVSEVYGRYMYGYIDEFRVSKGIARWTSSFAPGYPYGT